MRIFYLSFYIFFIFYSSLKAQNNLLSKEAILWADSVFATLTIEEQVAQLFIADSISNDDILSLKKKKIPQPGFIISHQKVFNPQKLTQNALDPFTILDGRQGFQRAKSNINFPDEATLMFMDKSLYEEYNSLFYYYLNQLHGFLASQQWASEFLSAHSNPKLPFVPMLNVWLPTGLMSLEQLQVYRMPRQFLRLKSQRMSGEQTVKVETGFIKSLDRIFNSKISIPSVEDMLGTQTLFYSTNYEEDFTFITNGFKNKWLPLKKLEKACKSVLEAKFYSANRSMTTSQPLKSVKEELLVREIYESSVAVFQKKECNVFPLNALSLKVGIEHDVSSQFLPFIKMAENYTQLTDSLEGESDLLLWLVTEESYFSVNFEEQAQRTKEKNNSAKVVMVWLGNPKLLPFSEIPSAIDALVMAPSTSGFMWEIVAQVIFNGIKTSANIDNSLLPISWRKFSVKMPVTRFKYGIAEEVGLSSDTLQQIDKIIDEAIKNKATPGAQLLIARKGVVVYQKSYGYQTYDKKTPVNNQTIYDLASITKIAATLPVLMRLYDVGRWKLSDTLANFIPETKNSDKEAIKISELLLHESGLLSYIPFYQTTIDTAKLEGYLFSRRKSSKYSIQVDERLYMNNTVTYRQDLFQPVSSANFSLQVANNLYLNKNYKDSILVRIVNSTRRAKEYIYSDLNFILLERLAHQITSSTLDTLSQKWFYNSMGASSLKYNPLKFYKADLIVPTEVDNYFRRQVVRGYVHDQGAAMLGGVSGHAGLFGNANDLAKVMQMYLNLGEYGGQRYLNSETIKFFTSTQNGNNRRGLGFDKPETNADKIGPTGKFVSPFSFGHTGFTGTIVWVDPAFDLIYIFLSNRTFPAGYNNKLGAMNVRTNIQDVIYQSIIVD